MRDQLVKEHKCEVCHKPAYYRVREVLQGPDKDNPENIINVPSGVVHYFCKDHVRKTKITEVEEI